MPSNQLTTNSLMYPNDIIPKIAIPQGRGVSCKDCSLSVKAVELVDVYQKDDERLESIRHCRKNAPDEHLVRVKHDSLIHVCERFAPIANRDANVPLFYALQKTADRLDSLQKAQSPGNDFMAAKAVAMRLVNGIVRKTMTRELAEKEIARVSDKSDLISRMAVIYFNNQMLLRDMKLNAISKISNNTNNKSNAKQTIRQVYK